MTFWPEDGHCFKSIFRVNMTFLLRSLIKKKTQTSKHKKPPTKDPKRETETLSLSHNEVLPEAGTSPQSTHLRTTYFASLQYNWQHCRWIRQPERKRKGSSLLIPVYLALCRKHYATGAGGRKAIFISSGTYLSNTSANATLFKSISSHKEAPPSRQHFSFCWFAYFAQVNLKYSCWIPDEAVWSQHSSY